MTVLNDLNSAGLTGLQGPGADMQSRLLDQMRNCSQEAMEFQAMLTDLQRSNSTFHMQVQSKQEELKSMTDIARDGIRKSGER